MIKLEAVSERDEVSGLGTLQEDILPQAINLITFQTPNSTALSTVVLSSSRHDDNSASVVKDVLGCPVVESRYRVSQKKCTFKILRAMMGGRNFGPLWATLGHPSSL